nr:membrane-bound lytic murein transglycosylase MltF [Methylonatrum kenyense]
MSGAIVALLVLLLAACEQPDDELDQPPADPIERSAQDRFHPDTLRQGGQLVVVTRNAPTTYFIDRHGRPAGPEHDLVRDFAQAADLRVRFIRRNSVAEILRALETGDAHLAAAGLVVTEEREQRFLAGPAYQEVTQQMVCRRNGRIPGSLDDMDGVRLAVAAETSYQARLRYLRDNAHPELSWITDPQASTEALLHRVWEQQIDCTVADSTIVALNRRYLPELEVAFPLGNPEPLVWLLPEAAEPLRQALLDWHEQATAAGRIEQLLKPYYDHVDLFDYVDVARFRNRIENRLPELEPHFREAAEQHGLDWQMLAAVGYQESHWDAAAESPTGVRGIMMLTRATAEELGIGNRTDPVQSIHGGARYLADLRERLPENINEPDRTWFALAAYNIGLSHVRDARRLTLGLGRDGDSWAAVSEVFPLLAEPEYHQNLPFGYAPGNVPVQYVQRVRNYEDMLREMMEE